MSQKLLNLIYSGPKVLELPSVKIYEDGSATLLQFNRSRSYEIYLTTLRYHSP